MSRVEELQRLLDRVFSHLDEKNWGAVLDFGDLVDFIDKYMEFAPKGKIG